MAAMRRLAPLFLLALAVAGCGGSVATLPPPQAAPPQLAELAWSEQAGEPGSRVVFSVRTLEIVRGGWRAAVSIRNETSATFGLGGPTLAPLRSFGVMLFRTGDHGELESRNRAGTLPTLRPARSFDPPLPAVLRPGQAWVGTLTAPGALAAGLWVRVVFGSLVAVGELPQGLRALGVTNRLVWITDHAYRLRADPQAGRPRLVSSGPP